MYISIGIIIVIAFVISVIITRFEIPVLRRKAGQNIREDGPSVTFVQGRDSQYGRDSYNNSGGSCVDCRTFHTRRICSGSVS